MHALRTPDDRFDDLPDHPWPPRYVEIDAGDGGPDRLRVHYVEDGPSDAAETVLLLHGEPSWSFLYRKVIPPLVAAGHRCVAAGPGGVRPVGQARSPERLHLPAPRRLVDRDVFERLDLRDVTLVCQDWGGLLGLRLVAEHPDRFRRVVAANTFLPTGDRDPGEAFTAWRTFSQEVEVLPVGGILRGATVSTLPDEVVAAYDAPFPDERYKEGARQFPVLVPATPDDPAAEPNRRAWTSLERFDKPFLCAFSDQDPVTAGADRHLRERIPGAQGLPHTTLEGGGHFLQEDVGPELAQVVVDLIATT
jgi:haloalkane dehalogenase